MYSTVHNGKFTHCGFLLISTLGRTHNEYSSFCLSSYSDDLHLNERFSCFLILWYILTISRCHNSKHLQNRSNVSRVKTHEEEQVLLQIYLNKYQWHKRLAWCWEGQRRSTTNQTNSKWQKQTKKPHDITQKIEWLQLSMLTCLKLTIKYKERSVK